MSKQPKTINVTGKRYHIMPALNANFLAKHQELQGCTHCAFWVHDDSPKGTTLGSGRCDRPLAMPTCVSGSDATFRSVVYVRRRDYRAHATLLELQEMGL